MNRAEVDRSNAVQNEMANLAVGIHVQELDGIAYIVGDATRMNSGIVTRDFGKAVSLVLFRQDRGNGVGILAAMPPDQARLVASGLIRAAEKIEAEAAELAGAALAKAARK